MLAQLNFPNRREPLWGFNRAGLFHWGLPRGMKFVLKSTFPQASLLFDYLKLPATRAALFHWGSALVQKRFFQKLHQRSVDGAFLRLFW
jgi:hypothetical protein